jgi:hypothetical protein
MPKVSKTYTTLFVVAAFCLLLGIYLCGSASVSEPLANSPVLLVGGASLIGFGLAASYLGLQSLRHHRAVVAHITRHDPSRRRVRVRKRKSPRIEPEDTIGDGEGKN